MSGLKNRSPAVDKYRVTLDADERAMLERLVAVGKGAARRLMCEPLRGWRHVKVTEHRTRRDYAECVRELVEVYYPEAGKIRQTVAGSPSMRAATEWIGSPAATASTMRACWT
jgi:hypothetical protein